MPEMDYSRLRGRIVECGLTQKECAEKIGVSEGQLNRKLAGEFAYRLRQLRRLQGQQNAHQDQHHHGRRPSAPPAAA